MSWTRYLRRAGLLLPILLTACASSGVYRDLRSDFDDSQETPYSRHETARPITTIADVASTEDFMNDVEKTLLATKQRWEQRLAEESPAETAAAPKADVRQLETTLSLELLLSLAQDLNPGVKAARRNLQATLEQYPQAAYLDNILRQYNAFTKQLDTKVGPRQHKQMQAMQFPYPDTLALKGRLVSEEAEIARRAVEIALRDARTQLRVAYYDILFVNDAIAINQENQQLLEQMIEVAQTKIRTGKATYNVVIMAQVELSKLTDAIITLEEQRETLKARINTLLSRPADAVLGKPQPLEDQDISPTLNQLYELAVQGRQELQQQRLRISRMQTMVELARRMAQPDPSLGASTFENGMSPEPSTGFSLRRDLNQRQAVQFGQSDAYRREIELKADALGQVLTEMEDQTRFKVKQAHFGLEAAKRSIALYRQSLLPQAQQSVEATTAGYRTGEIDFLTFLDTERTLLKFRLEEQRAWRDFRTSQAQLDQLNGGKLPRQPFKLTDATP